MARGQNANQGDTPAQETTDSAQRQGSAGGATQSSSPSVITTQAELDAQANVEASRTDQAVADPDAGAVRPLPLVNDQNTGPTAEEAVAQVEAETDGHASDDPRPMVTRVEGQEPGTAGFTAPGDAPYDTTDPNERVSTVPAAGELTLRAAKAGLGSFVSAVKTGEVGVTQVQGGNRTERSSVVVDQAGNTVEVERDLDTGRSKRVG